MSDKFFNEKYLNIVQKVKPYLENLDTEINNHFNQYDNDRNEILPIIKEFLANKGKRIRPVVIFLVLKALNRDIKPGHYKIAMSNELIHNATLIHDDIIDCSLIRRGKKTLNFNYDSKLAVLAGDYLLAEVLEILSDIESKEIRKIYSNALSYLINGELNQYFHRFKILTIEDYIEKSKNKTARLFEAGIVSAYLFESNDKQNLENIRDFALNFGIAFQIYNDLENLNSEDKLNEDIQNGDYSAPVIFYAQEKCPQKTCRLDNSTLILKQLKKTSAIEKTKELIKIYITRAIENLSFIEDNLYKQTLIELCQLYITEKNDG